MKIFIVGGAGFVGSNFIKKFHNYYEIILCQSSENEELSKFCIKNNIIVEKCKLIPVNAGTILIAIKAMKAKIEINSSCLMLDL